MSVVIFSAWIATSRGAAGLEHLGGALDRLQDDAELDADGVDVERARPST